MRIFSRYLLWFLIAALPLQGMAVTTMRCGDGMARGHEMQSVQMLDDSGSAVTDRQQQEDHCAKPGNDGDDDHEGCGHCAGCAVGASAPPRLPAFTPDLPLASSHHAAGEAAMTPHIPTTPKRPPRYVD